MKFTQRHNEEATGERAIEVIPNSSMRYEEFESFCRMLKKEPTREIAAVYRYFEPDPTSIEDDVGEEQFYVMENLSVEAPGYGKITSSADYVGYSKQFPLTNDYIWNKSNIQKIAKHFTRNTNFYIRWEGISRSQIARNDWINKDRKTIAKEMKSVKIDLSDLERAVNTSGKL